MLNGETFAVILEDEYLYNHFIFLAYFSHSVVGYNFQSDHKRKLVSIINRKFPGNLKVLAVGDAFNDLEMLSAADFSVQVQSFYPDSFKKKQEITSILKRNS